MYKPTYEYNICLIEFRSKYPNEFCQNMVASPVEGGYEVWSLDDPTKVWIATPSMCQNLVFGGPVCMDWRIK